MNKPLKLIPIGNSTGVILPKDVLAELGAEQGDIISYIKTPDGIELRTTDADFDAQMEAAREVMKRRRKALRELAK
ncbi:MAG TPA: AbrB/MazE/SpoVT family DNA-binding domain-containing protein [Sphingomicrobium sp.]|jgi:putative addiction module antidote|nr:AbrB/MazE/SpoVT family DNA-binding domain-containing protein [Sphingomicrobium sp.]